MVAQLTSHDPHNPHVMVTEPAFHDPRNPHRKGKDLVFLENKN
jgi:hypothetical protein